MTKEQAKRLYIEGIKELLEETPDFGLVHLIYTILWKSKEERKGVQS